MGQNLHRRSIAFFTGRVISLTSPQDFGSNGLWHLICRPSTQDALGIWARARP